MCRSAQPPEPAQTSLTHEQAQLLAQREAQLQAMHAERFDAIAELARLSGAVQWSTPPLAHFLGERWVSRQTSLGKRQPLQCS